MTDNDIIKALECCKGEAVPCSECIYADFGQCQIYMADDALKLIKRQQAEIKQLRDLTKMIKAEAISEMNARLYAYKTDIYIRGEELMIIPSSDYDYILKELTEVSNGE